ncbi:MAG: 6-aminohexanoate hydrolase [Pseudomonas sp.]|uniref:serine hydrolase domain-containing protein n=3 Tax=Stutzerimonas stutzeri subgroup TaxID=578833 RepID=UPI000B25E30B|nr:6-aminohexanoate hydrolase [Pseudomonas sp.]MBD3876963.1 serine hydrolase [Stutzerimonas kunmingensis]HAG77270.1 6-aminohexanoate hydrolase [Pseudomonas sp.]HCH76694.1 6-aminohexanoate hydrolase [Pseudomonas sp.]
MKLRRSRELAKVHLCCLFGAMACSAYASEPAEFPDAQTSDPATMGWMVGSPPPADRILRFEDGSYFRFPQMRWSVVNFRQLMPTVNVSRGLGESSLLEHQPSNEIDALTFVPLGGGEPMTWQQSLQANYTDGIIILHRGKLVYERYFGVLKPEGQHAAMSITKTFTGTLAALLVAEEKLDPERLVADYVPELAASGFGDASVRQLMDMTTGIHFSEDYADPKAEVWAHAAAGNPLPKPADYQGPRTYYEFLQTVKPQGRHGEAFNYRTANSDALGWVIARVSGQNVAQLLSERIWSRLGAEQDAYMSVDSIGTPFAGGGLNASLRDLVRFGEMMRNEGRYNGTQILPPEVVADIRGGANRDDFAKAGYRLLPGWSYRNMWWVSHNEHGAFMARGVHGQALYVDPLAEMVIARFASHPVASNAANDPTSLPAYEAVARHLLNAADSVRKVRTPLD